MTKNIKYAAFASLLLAPLVAASQDVDADSAEFVVDPTEQTVPVADEETVSKQATNEISEERLLTEFALYRRQLQDGTLDAADVTAKRIVEMAIRVYGPQSRETANALNNLGIVQHGNGQYDAAIQNFTSAVGIIEIVEDRLNDALVNPLKGLGAAQLGNGRPDQARQTFVRAAHITEVNEGPHNLDQIEILESIAEANIRMGDTKSARDILDRIHILNVRHFQEDPLGLLPSLMSRAQWQHRAGYYADERTTYRRAIRIIETSSDKNNPMLVMPLRRLGESFYFVDLSMPTPQQQGLISTGEVYFKRASRIAEKAANMDWREAARARLALGDYYTYVDSQNRARKTYRKVWDELSSDEERVAQRNEWLNNPVAVRANTLPTIAGDISSRESTRDAVLSGEIVVEYSVSIRGRVKDLRTEAFPPEFTDMQRVVHREIRSRIHRPRIVDGIPVKAEDLRFEHVFSYLESDLTALREAKTSADEEQQRSN